MTGVLFYPTIYNDTAISSYMLYEQDHPSALRKSYTEIQDSVNSSKFAADATLFIVWAAVGLLLYSLAEVFIKLFTFFVVIKNKQRTQPSDGSKSVIDMGKRAFVRFAAIGAIYMLGLVTIGYGVPLVVYVLSLISPGWALVLAALLLWFVVLALIHALVVLTRLVFLRTRLLESK